MLDTKRRNISRIPRMDKIAGSERVPLVALEKVSGQRITPTRFPDNRTSRSSISNSPLHEQTPTGCNVQGIILGRPQTKIEAQGYRFLDPEQRMSLLMEYTSSRQNRNFGTVASFGMFEGLK